MKCWKKVEKHDAVVSCFRWSRFLFVLPHHVCSQGREERLLDEVSVVCVEKLLCGLLGLHGRQFVSLGFESADNVSDDSTLNTIGLDLFRKRKREKKIECIW